MKQAAVAVAGGWFSPDARVLGTTAVVPRSHPLAYGARAKWEKPACKAAVSAAAAITATVAVEAVTAAVAVHGSRARGE